jgi:hypothetical protein
MPKKDAAAEHWKRFTEAVKTAIAAPKEQVEEREKEVRRKLERRKGKSSGA